MSEKNSVWDGVGTTNGKREIDWNFMSAVSIDSTSSVMGDVDSEMGVKDGGSLVVTIRTSKQISGLGTRLIVSPNKMDEEEVRRWEYERWELDQAMSGIPGNEWEPFVPSDMMEAGEKENKRNIIKNLKRPKEETPKERWERIEEEKEKKENKLVKRVAKKMRKEGKMRDISSYFTSS
jgi:hypothetical protein